MKTTYVVCPECRGHGTVDNKNFNGMSGSDFDSQVDADEFSEGYMDGIYSVPCPVCRGNRVTTRRQIREYQKERENTASERAYSRGYDYACGIYD